jgi:hypothetical protein
VAAAVAVVASSHGVVAALVLLVVVAAAGVVAAVMVLVKLVLAFVGMAVVAVTLLSKDRHLSLEVELRVSYRSASGSTYDCGVGNHHDREELATNRAIVAFWIPILLGRC